MSRVSQYRVKDIVDNTILSFVQSITLGGKVFVVMAPKGRRDDLSSQRIYRKEQSVARIRTARG